ncbi:POU domain, class 6, transcription factor 1-like, partial [Phasianus colchicus]|uniref:POU domain, class 6, transcription factor 1-like n=1 Tax=Phasianus colchicus TaxID=9054 RepID=UPI00129ED5F3
CCGAGLGALLFSYVFLVPVECQSPHRDAVGLGWGHCSDPQVQPIQPAPALSQPAVVITSPAPAAKATPAPIPITCSETPTVSQLVSKPAAPNSSAEEDGINLEEIREFAKNFKIRRLSLGLTQTQVGQALTATEGPAYSQSAICRCGVGMGQPLQPPRVGPERS